MTEVVFYEVADRIATITLNRPDRRNAGNVELVDALTGALRRARMDDAVRAVLLTGAGSVFCSGADLSQMEMAGDGLSPGQSARRTMERSWNPLATTLKHLGKPTVAAVNGPAVGAGVGIGLACDIVIAAESANVAVVFGPQLALIPDVGCTWLLPRLLGPARARGLALLGDALPAIVAADWGLIWQAVPDSELLSTSRNIAARLAGFDQLSAVRITEALDLGLVQGFDEQLAHEARVQGDLIDRPTLAEGVRAFSKSGRRVSIS